MEGFEYFTFDFLTFCSFFSFLFLKKYGQNPLDGATFNGHHQVVKILLEKGGNVNSQRKVFFFLFLFQGVSLKLF